MSSPERLRLEQDVALYPDDLLVGAATNGLIHLEPNQPVTLAIDQRTGKPVDPINAVFASRSLEVSSFCAAVYSRDGWSGWNTYKNTEDTGELYEFFAAPHVLRRALLAMQNGRSGSVYRVKSDGFQPYEPISGQYISIAGAGPVPVEDEYRVNIMDMRQPIACSAYLGRAEQARPGFTRHEPPRLNVAQLLRKCGVDAPVLNGVSPDQAAIALRQYTW